MKSGLQRLAEAHRLGGNDVHQRAALHSREHDFVDRLCVLGLGEDQAGARTAQRLVRGGGDDLRVRHRRRMRSAATSPAKCAMSTR